MHVASVVVVVVYSVEVVDMQRVPSVDVLNCREHGSGDTSGRRGRESVLSLVNAWPVLASSSVSTDKGSKMSASGISGSTSAIGGRANRSFS